MSTKDEAPLLYSLRILTCPMNLIFLKLSCMKSVVLTPYSLFPAERYIERLSLSYQKLTLSPILPDNSEPFT